MGCTPQSHTSQMGKIAVSDPRLGFPEHRLGAGRKLERVVGEGACQADPTSPPPPVTPHPRSSGAGIAPSWLRAVGSSTPAQTSRWIGPPGGGGGMPLGQVALWRGCTLTALTAAGEISPSVQGAVHPGEETAVSLLPSARTCRCPSLSQVPAGLRC